MLVASEASGRLSGRGDLPQIFSHSVLKSSSEES